jgi:hypothetical protein
MADTVDVKVLRSSTKAHTVRLTNVSDATGEAAVVKIDRSTLLNSAGVEPVSLSISEIKWVMQGFTSVRLFWDATADDEIAVLSGTSGHRCYDPPMNDPRSAGNVGDILLTTAGAAAGATYDIEITVIY